MLTGKGKREDSGGSVEIKNKKEFNEKYNDFFGKIKCSR